MGGGVGHRGEQPQRPPPSYYLQQKPSRRRARRSAPGRPSAGRPFPPTTCGQAAVRPRAGNRPTSRSTGRVNARYGRRSSYSRWWSVLAAGLTEISKPLGTRRRVEASTVEKRGARPPFRAPRRCPDLGPSIFKSTIAMVATGDQEPPGSLGRQGHRGSGALRLFCLDVETDRRALRPHALVQWMAAYLGSRARL